ncbi:UDP-N-acetylglucosamine--N-acetylmuramyl-(pentapeptide) pyrophosphoryl-undecaprenol N-acetylglucosamine transferase [Candidatus Parcubacteria bacterium]|nr:MAG: UDP-N-acetylglucosamine--N-acetylmuramyl-(pentapeptide) pyrophosphoryl-undecaprenol N-acetylglucosamine transferase [Candidatus Parcubacteria bacterium]
MKILITGGHFSPALSIIEKIRKEADIFVVGRKYSLEGEKSLSFEYKVCQQNNIPFVNITTGRLQRKFNKNTLASLVKVPLGFFQSLSILAKYKPDVVLTFGGYIALPVSLAAFIFRIPIVVHEQTQKAGISNKITSLFANKVCISFESSKEFFPKDKLVYTGNPTPVKESISKVSGPAIVPNILKNIPILYVTGGSSGSHFINNLLFESIEDLLSKFVVIHQTGDSKEFEDYDKLTVEKGKLSNELRKRYILEKHIYPKDLGWILNNASLVVSRAGINTVLELLMFGKPCFLIPLPYGQQNEQLDNAQLVKRTGLGDYMEQKNITVKMFLDKIFYMIDNREKYLSHKGEARKYYIEDAAERVINVVKSVYVNEKKNKKNI